MSCNCRLPRLAHASDCRSILLTSTGCAVPLLPKSKSSRTSLARASQSARELKNRLQRLACMAAPTLQQPTAGLDAFENGMSYSAEDYRDGVQLIFDKLRTDPALLTDNRRVELSIPHV